MTEIRKPRVDEDAKSSFVGCILAQKVSVD